MSKPSSFSGLRVKVGRRLVQTGFLLLFLIPWLPVLMSHSGRDDLPPLTSWLLPFDTLLNGVRLLHGDFPWLVIGPTVFILVFSWVFGRAFCGWICPLGTLLDWVRPLALWQKNRKIRPSSRNSIARFSLLLFLIAASVFSLRFTGWFDPLVIFNRTASSLIFNFALFDLTNPRIVPFYVSLLFLGILILEFFRPRFWCRHLCPFGALISLPARFSVLKRRVTGACTLCGDCRRVCPMQAVGIDPRDTRYMDCTLCLDCDTACPNQGIRFEFGNPFQNKLPQPDVSGESHPPKEKNGITRREAISLLAAGGAGLAAAPLAALASPKTGLVRPPGALAEAQFVKTCITCQECIRICPGQALRPALLEGGFAAIGTPYLAPRQGACSFVTGCPQLCAQVCPVGAIRPIPVARMKTGIARVDHHACLAWDQGTKCLVCVEACPSNAAKSINGRVIVDAEKCTGCGRCESGCPVSGSAIRVYPLT